MNWLKFLRGYVMVWTALIGSYCFYSWIDNADWVPLFCLVVFYLPLYIYLTQVKPIKPE